MILAQGFTRFVLDLDGVVWTGGRPIPGAPETIRALRDAGRRFVFLTNNSSELAETFAKKLARFGAGGDPEEVVTSAHAVARLLQSRYPDLRGRTAYVIGGSGLTAALREAGVHLVDGADAIDASLVAVGLDRELTYEKLRIATLAIRRGAFFVASNDDATMPAEDGQWPGCGAIVAALKAATGAAPAIAGKPEPVMLDLARERVGGDGALVVGDRVSTDILAARAAGWPNALVLTGATSIPELAASAVWPDAVIRTLSDLLVDLPYPSIRPATGPDLPRIAQMLHGGGLQAGNVRERAGRSVVAQTGRDTLVATAAWDPAGESNAVVRSVAVTSQLAGKGVGRLVVAGALRSAINAGATDAWLVTQTAEPFFETCGFARVDRDDLPEEVASHPQITRECGPDAAVMHAALPKRQNEPSNAGGRREGRSTASSTMPARKPPM